MKSIPELRGQMLCHESYRGDSVGQSEAMIMRQTRETVVDNQGVKAGVVELSRAFIAAYNWLSLHNTTTDDAVIRMFSLSLTTYSFAQKQHRHPLGCNTTRRGQQYVPRFLCSPVPMFPGTDVPRFFVQ